jgi:hypothetical protein
MSVSIESERDVSNVRNVARLSARALSFPITDQARIGWAVANLARMMLMLGIHDTMIIAHVMQDGRWGIRVTCRGAWLRMVSHSWIEKTALSEFSQWVDEIHFADGTPPYLMVVLWPREAQSELGEDNGTSSLAGRG